jgi:hypothetical protein
MDPSELKLPKEVAAINVDFIGPGICVNYIYMSGENSMIFECGGVFL